jgi:hypothetical protein
LPSFACGSFAACHIRQRCRLCPISQGVRARRVKLIRVFGLVNRVFFDILNLVNARIRDRVTDRAPAAFRQFFQRCVDGSDGNSRPLAERLPFLVLRR